MGKSIVNKPSPAHIVAPAGCRSGFAVYSLLENWVFGKKTGKWVRLQPVHLTARYSDGSNRVIQMNKNNIIFYYGI
jgi:hypothetical protein